MFASLLITFRETLEVALVIGIIVTYLSRTERRRDAPLVYWGVLSGVAASMLTAFLLSWLAGGFSGRAEQLFEGATMLFAAALLTTLILWMLHQQGLAQLKRKVHCRLSTGARRGLFLLVFVSVLREGVEVVLFLGAAHLAGEQTIIGAVLGILFGAGIAVAVSRLGKRVPIKKFFIVTSILLILFAAGLVAQGVHELQEAGALPVVIEHVWDINPPATHSALHEKGVVGSLAKSLFGYNGDPSLLEVLAYLSYLAVATIFAYRLTRK
ncbi:high-affinity iron transporter [Candidatus Woesearchaeota archaeon]|nr:MAG: high-affinity iron transporter [Candidatus Woesearchaeota archaeon]